MGIEFFAAVIGLPLRSAEVARRAEAQGWTGLAFADSQNLFSDPYVAMVVAASATTTLRLATGVTNPVTRHAATTANVITSVDLESGGRAELGIGRGDSALAHIGLAPTSVEYLAEYVDNVRSYLRGDAISLEAAAGSSAHRSISSLPLGDAPEDSHLHWLPADDATRTPVPVYVVASGPKMIAMAAARADRVTLAVGADVDRIRWAVDIAKAADPTVAVGAYVNVVVDDDRERGAEHAAGAVAAFAALLRDARTDQRPGVGFRPDRDARSRRRLPDEQARPVGQLRGPTRTASSRGTMPSSARRATAPNASSSSPSWVSIASTSSKCPRRHPRTALRRPCFPVSRAEPSPVARARCGRAEAVTRPYEPGPITASVTR